MRLPKPYLAINMHLAGFGGEILLSIIKLQFFDIQISLGNIHRAQQHLGAEFIRPGAGFDCLDILRCEALGPCALPVSINQGKQVTGKPIQKHRFLADFGAGLIRINRVIIMWRADI